MTNDLREEQAENENTGTTHLDNDRLDAAKPVAQPTTPPNEKPKRRSLVGVWIALESLPHGM